MAQANWPVDARLTAAYWKNSALVLGAFLLVILVGAAVTRIMVGFNRSGWADLLMVVFFAVWVLYGGVWVVRFLPTTRPQPTWLARSRGWLDAAGLLLLIGLAVAARSV